MKFIRLDKDSMINLESIASIRREPGSSEPRVSVSFIGDNPAVRNIYVGEPAKIIWLAAGRMADGWKVYEEIATEVVNSDRLPTIPDPE